MRVSSHAARLWRVRTPAYPACGRGRWPPRAPVGTRASSTKRDTSDPASYLAQPTWSVSSLRPPASSAVLPSDPVTPKQLHHLLRLSALPLPKTAEEEAEMIEVLQSQLHFVQDIQRVNTSGVEPLRSIRDETVEGLEEATIGVAELKEVLENETAFGRMQRPRRKRAELDTKGIKDWDVLGSASETAGKYFVVRSGKSAKDT